MTDARPATVRFYFDADVLGVAKVVAALRYDVTYPGDPGATIHRRIRPACPITTPAARDESWIPEVACRGWLVVTRDRHTQGRPEIAAVRDSGTKMVTLSAADAGSIWNPTGGRDDELAELEDLASQEGPFVWRATRSGLGAVNLG